MCGLCCSDDGTVEGVGLRTNVTITATVRNINDVPVWVPMPNVSVPENSLPSAVLFTVRALDADVTDKRTLLSRICWRVTPWRPNSGMCVLVLRQLRTPSWVATRTTARWRSP